MKKYEDFDEFDEFDDGGSTSIDLMPYVRLVLKKWKTEASAREP